MPRMVSAPTPVALTIDDAPMLLPEYSQLPDAVTAPETMDTLRESLQQLGVPHCVAFVIGAVGNGSRGSLSRWLEAGYELGNHTHDHVPAKNSSPRRFLESVDRCDAFLQGLGAFPPGRTKWFRFPWLSYGADEASRRELRAAVRARGYRIAHASTDLYDHPYEGPLGLATRARDASLEGRILRRFHRSALFSVWQSRRLIARHFDPETPLVIYSHFGRVSLLGLRRVLENLTRRGVRWCSLEDAHRHPFYERLDDANSATGLATGDLPRSLAWRCMRKASNSLRPLMQHRVRRLGPGMPALTGG